MPEGEFVREVEGEMERWTLIGRNVREQTVVIRPSAGKLTGRYPEDFMSGKKIADKGEAEQ